MNTGTTVNHPEASSPNFRSFDKFGGFSPEGRLYQVQYAERATSRGWPVVGVTNGKDCCVICASNRRLSGLQDLTMIDKVSELRPGVFMAFAGLAADGRVLVHQARDFVGRFRMDHAEDASIQDIALAIAELQHLRTSLRQNARPYGVSCVIAGLDEGGDGLPKVFTTEPSGVYNQWEGVAVGQSARVLCKLLEDHHQGLSEMGPVELARLSARAVMGSGVEADCELVVIRRCRRSDKGVVIKARRVVVSSKEEVEALSEKDLGLLEEDEGQQETEEEEEEEATTSRHP